MNERCKLATLALLFALPVNAEIYRCETDGTVAFSDRPCGPDSALYTQGQDVSFVAPDENLPAIAQATQAFIKDRREQMARRRSARQAPSPLARAPHTKVETVFLPWLPARTRHDHHPWNHTRGNDQTTPPVVADNDRYSPLNGPILGTRRNSAAFDHRPQLPDRRPERKR